MQPASDESTCPACLRPRGAGAECPGCGLIYARWRGPRPAPPSSERPGAGEQRLRLSLLRQERLYQGLAEALEAGLTPQAFLESARGALPAGLLAALRKDAAAGLSLSRTLGRVGILQGAELAFLQAGETTGAVPASLRLLARRVAERRRDRGRILLALAYPLVLLLGAVIIVPAPLIFRDGFGAYAARVLPLLGGSALVGFVALVLLPRMDREAGPRRFLRRLGLLLPATSQALRNGSIATFLEVLGTAAASGLSIRQALPLAQDAAPHPAFRSEEPLLELDRGATLAAALASLRILPPATLAQIAQAEGVGSLDRTLPALVADHRQRARTATLLAVGAVGVLAAGAVVTVLAWSVVEAWLAYFRQVEEVAG